MDVHDVLPHVESREVEEFVKAVLESHSDCVQEIILFGSAARGELGPESDIDIMVIAEQRDLKLLDHLAEIANDLSLNHGRDISFKLLSKQQVIEMERLKMPFFMNVRREGIELWKRR